MFNAGRPMNLLPVSVNNYIYKALQVDIVIECLLVCRSCFLEVSLIFRKFGTDVWHCQISLTF